MTVIVHISTNYGRYVSLSHTNKQVSRNFMKNREIIENLIGAELTEGTIESYYYKNELINLVLKTYLKFENKWIEIVSTDEMTFIRLSDENIANYREYGNEEFKYTCNPFSQIYPEFNNYVGKKLLNIKEIVKREDESLSFGITLNFSENLFLTIFNHDYPKDENEILFARLNNTEYKEL